MPQGRNTNTYTLSDDAAYQRGSHYIQFGFHGQKVRVRSYDAAGVVPTYSLAMGTGQPAPHPRQSCRHQQHRSGHRQRAAGHPGRLCRWLQPDASTSTSRTSGFVPGAPFVRHFRFDDYASTCRTNGRSRRASPSPWACAGSCPAWSTSAIRWNSRPSLPAALPQTLLSNATLNFAGARRAVPGITAHWKDFAPNIGFAWDVFGDGKTALRGGYSISYVNDQELIAPENMLEANAGLQGISADTGLSDRVSTGLPPISRPDVTRSPFTTAENYANNPFNVVAMVDPNLHRPYVQQYSIGIQHDFKGTVFEARYVGNHVVGAYRAFDFNQVQIVQNGFLADFLRAQNNGLSGAKCRPRLQPQLTTPASRAASRSPSSRCSIRVRVLTDSDVRQLHPDRRSRRVGHSLPDQRTERSGAISSRTPMRWPPTCSRTTPAPVTTRCSWRRATALSHGLSFEANYTFSKVLSDGDGDLQTRFQAFLDINNPGLERSRANFDLNHMIKADGSTNCRSARPPLASRAEPRRSAAGLSAAPWSGSPARRSRFSRAAEPSTAKRAPTTTPPPRSSLSRSSKASWVSR